MRLRAARVAVLVAASKNQNPREGIETLTIMKSFMTSSFHLQKTKIPARGLKRALVLL